MIRVGLIGRGVAGSRFHTPLIRATAGLALAGVAGSAEADGLIRDPSIDLIVVASPDHSHAPLAEAALQAGKHVVVEKPFVTASAEGERLVALADRLGLALIPFHNRRWDGDFLTVRDLVGSGRLGPIRLFEAHWDRFRPTVPAKWREQPGPGAGTLWNLGPHLIDQMLVLFGAPDAVLADIAAQRDRALVDDYFHLTFHYGAMRAILGSSNLVADPRPRFALHGPEASFVRHGLDSQEDALEQGADPAAAGFGRNDAVAGMLTRPGGIEAVPTKAGRYLGFYEGVVATIATGAASPVPAADALAGVRLIEAARRSSDTGTVVRLT